MQYSADTPVAAPQQLAFERVRNRVAPGGTVAGSTSTQVVAPTLIAWDGLQGKTVTRFRVEFAPAAGGSTLTVRYEFTGEGGGGLLAYPLIRRKIKQTAQEYRAIAEGRG